MVATITVFVLLAANSLGASSIWFDEAFGAYLVHFNFGEIFKFTALDVHPPLYYWVLKLWGLLFGTGDVALRSMSIFFGAIALVFAYLLMRKIFTNRTALLVLPMLAVSPIFIRYAQEARMYTMVLAIGLAATYVLYGLQKKPSRKGWATYGVLVSLGMWTHYFTALIWLGHWVWRAIITHKKSLQAWSQKFFSRDWVLAHVLAVGLFLPWLPWLVRQILDVQVNGFWIPPVGPETIPAYLSDVFLYQTVGGVSPWLTVALGVFVALAGYLVWATYRYSAAGQKPGYLLLIVSALAPIALLIMMSLPPLQSTFIDRYILTAAVLLVAVIGVAIVLAPKKYQTVKMAAGALLVILSFVGITNVYHYGNYNMFAGQKSQTKQLVQAIRATPGTAGQPIIANTPWIYYEAAQYSNGENGVYFIDKYVEYKFGSLEMLKQSDKGKIKDLDGFLQANTKLWYIGRPGDADIDPPAGNVRMLQRIDIADPITGKAAYQAVQYETTAE